MGAVVVAPMVVATTTDHRVIYLSAGDTVPDNVTPEALDHLLGLGFVEDEPATVAKPLVELPKAKAPRT